MSDSVRTDLRNVAIIAHVDHGKTTLVDGLLTQANTFRPHEHVGVLIMDTNDLERERGITILAKNTSVTYHPGPISTDEPSPLPFGGTGGGAPAVGGWGRDNAPKSNDGGPGGVGHPPHPTPPVTINIIDTPGHADFGGEVERVLNMADGCLLLVDAVEGPMPQTRFVLRKALELGLRPLLVINKIDRPAARPAEVLAMTEALFLELATDAEQLDFPVLYANAKAGTASTDPALPGADLRPLFEAIVRHVPPPMADPESPLQMLVTALDADDYVGKIVIGRIRNGAVARGMPVARIARDGSLSRAKVGLVYRFKGLGREEVESAAAGDIVALTGLEDAGIGDTIADAADPRALPTIDVDQPTVKMTFGVNTSPFAGREGKYVTSRQIRARLLKELETNVALRVEETDSAETLLVSGRGELHLAILIETMRREGYEFQVSRPEVITRELEGRLHEPVEHLVIDAREEHVGFLTESLARRLGRMVNLQVDPSRAGGSGGVRLEFSIPTRGLIGFRNQFLTATRGEGTMASILLGYEPWRGPIAGARNGALVADQDGVAVTYGLANAQERGDTFTEPGTPVYEGMIIGLNAREGEISINVAKQKKQTNIRSSTAEIAVRLTPAVQLSLEQCLDFLEPDELLEVTPQSLRLRKRTLNATQRRRQAATA
jgi:GTP-binding protein